MPREPADLRVALFTGNYNSCVDGVALVLNRLVAHLERRGVRVLVFAPTSKKAALEHSGTLISVPSLGLPLYADYRVAWGLPRRIERQVRDFAPHVFHVASPEPLGFAALRLSRRMGVPAVATFHTNFSCYLKYHRLGFLEPLSWKMLRRFYNQARETYVASASMREVLLGQGFTCPMQVWSRGVDSGKFHPGRASLEWRRSLGIGGQEFLVGFVGRVVQEKAIGVWGDVVQKLEQSGRPIRSIMIGDGPALPLMRKRLPSTLFPGYMPHDQLATAVASMDAFLFPSISEAFSNVVQEAMASGVPPVAVDASGVRDLITDGVDGFLCEPDNVEELAGRVLQLADDPALRQRLRETAVTRASASSWEAILEQMLQHYLRFADGAARRS